MELKIHQMTEEVALNCLLSPIITLIYIQGGQRVAKEPKISKSPVTSTAGGAVSAHSDCLPRSLSCTLQLFLCLA